MSGKRVARIAVDTGLYALMLALLSYPVTRGLYRHGLLGAAFLFLLVVHQLLNLAWYKTLFKGRSSSRRTLTLLVDLALLGATVALGVSSLAMAGEVFSFAPFVMPYWGRSLHTFATAWFFVLASFHLGLHAFSFWNFLHDKLGRLTGFVFVAVVCQGLYSLVQSGLALDMFWLYEQRARPESVWHFLVMYGSITAMLAIMAHGTVFLCTKKTQAKSP